MFDKCNLVSVLGSIRVHYAWGHTISVLYATKKPLDGLTELGVGVEQNEKKDSVDKVAPIRELVS